MAELVDRHVITDIRDVRTLVQRDVRELADLRRLDDVPHLRARVDVVLEDAAGRVAMLEVKSGMTVRLRDATAMAKLRDRLRDRFVAAVVLHGGENAHSMGDRIWALPVGTLWNACRDARMRHHWYRPVGRHATRRCSVTAKGPGPVRRRADAIAARHRV